MRAPTFIPILTAILGIGAGIVGIGISLLLFLTSPTAGLFGLLFIGLYIGAYYLLLRKSPLNPHAGFRWAALCFIWGGGVSMALITLVGAPILDLTEKLGIFAFAASFGGAYPEELIKALGVILIMASFRKLNKPWHGFVTGILVGLGFDTIENLGYGIVGANMHPDSDVAGVLQMWGLRTLAGPGLHSVLTGFAGYGIGLAMCSIAMSNRQRLLHALKWLALAFSIHFLWNIAWPNLTLQYASVIILVIVSYTLFIRLWRRLSKEAAAYRELPTTPITNLKELNQHWPMPPTTTADAPTIKIAATS
ncbi:MAG: PrsW family intramembrane metalloprotease [Corynebacterium sp.]|uniref:PrsW family intramembrane metalloprotease n=1 Tax=Corynebacterium sp. TaxID=1720 RepID=UPI0026DA71C5|nr:PrsW family intramembrane metalloprotease [Corynebacterium sp.]MDO4761871.1 PrsW family intramembrane metalloprotease [Corynebacterium sp.]